MFHSYKKSKFTNQKLWDNLESCGFNQYELKHFCFSSDETGGESGADFDVMNPTPEAQKDANPADFTARERGDFADVAGLGTRGAGMGPMGTAQSYTDPTQTAYDVTPEQVADQQQARDFELTYGVPYGSVTPAYEADPAGPQTISYPTFGMGLSEMGRGLGMGLGTIADSMPGPVSGLLGAVMGGPEGTFRGTVGKAFGQDYTGKSLADQVGGAFRDIQSQAALGNPEASKAAMEAEIDATKDAMSADDYMTEAQFNAAVQGPPDATDIQGLVDISPPTISEQIASSLTPSEKSAADYFAAFAGPPSQPQSSVDSFDVPPSQPQSSVDYWDELINTTPTPSTAEDFYGGIPDGNETIPLIIPETPTATPVVEEEEVDIATATPRTRTASVSNLDLLRSIYGDDIANALLPTRTV